MSKRRINKQQAARIQKKQTSIQEQIATESELEKGLVICRYGKHAEIEDDYGNLVHCSIRPNLEAIVAGDTVFWQKEGTNQGVVVSCLPRTSVLGRPDKLGKIKPVAANITQILIVIAPKPQISWSLLDSYLVLAEYFNFNVRIVLNKTDLIENNVRDQLRYYRDLGYPVVFTTNTDQTSYKILENVLDKQTSVFVGQSGVGKSSLISKMLPHETRILTSAISSQSELGKHTTSFSYFYHIPTGGALIDSPGVREIGLWHMPKSQISAGFKEIKPFIAQCKFRNCDHQQDPGCAIKEAVKKGIISAQRYENYVRISAQFSN